MNEPVVEVKHIPVGCNGLFHPVDVGNNCPFKCMFNCLWDVGLFENDL